MPARIQRRRTKGWRMPEGAIFVGRPTRWGNPFPVGVFVETGTIARPGPQIYVRDNAHAVRLYRRWIDTQARSADMIPLLGGHDLACWCKLSDPCHADVLLELANPAWFRP